jgi:hypothetical protein
MRANKLKAILKAAVRALCILPFAAVAAFGQQTINLTAGPTTVTLPDGSTVPMWGYSCGTAAAGATAICAALNPASAATATTGATWSPVVITVPTGQALTINLTNNLSFVAGTGTNTVPTSLVIVGQLGGGLGTTATTTASPDHTNAQGATTWPIAGGPGGTAPTQGTRVQSFSTEVAFGATAALTWSAPRPGTYLIESGTHPSIQGPMGLYGILVVTAAPVGNTAGTAYPAIGTTVPAVSYNAEVPLLFSEIDPIQNNAVSAAVSTAGFLETNVWSGQPGGCGNPSSPVGIYQTCYPPAVNYTPLYYLINGVAFNKTSATTSRFTTTPATGVPTAGTVLVRMVNAGLRMHVPSIVGSQTGTAVPPATIPPAGFTLIAEDGNPLPGVHRVQSEVFMAAGKTYDVMINVPAATATTALPVFDRELSLSGNAIARDAGMLAYIGVNGANTLPAAAALAPAIARADTYNALLATGQTLTVADPSRGVIANDTNVYGVQLLTPPANGTLTLNANGTFTYVPNGTATSDSFSYCANGVVTGATCSSGITAPVTLGAAVLESAAGIHVGNKAYTSTVAGSLSIKPSGVLGMTWTACTPSATVICHDYDAAGYPLTVNLASVAPSAGLSLTMNPNGDGGFSASVSAAGSYSFTYQAQNSQGVVSAGAPATVTLNFPAPSGLVVKVLDGVDKTTAITDYRWIIEEDRTFYNDPNKTTNTGGTSTTCVAGAVGCPLVPIFGVNFHTSYMPVVATGCVGPAGSAVSCESGQSVLGVQSVCDIGNGVCEPGAQKTAVDPSQVALDPMKRYYISILPGDAANPFNTGNAVSGHSMGGAPIPAACTPLPPATTCTGTFAPLTVLVEPNPLQPAKLSVFVFEDDFPLNGEQDAGGGVDVLATNEPGLGGFEITLFDDAGGSGDATGQLTHDMFNQPLSNSLAGTMDPANNNIDACPISQTALVGMDSTNGNAPGATSALGITGRIVTCPTYEADGVTLSPLAGQAVVANMMAGRYGVVATPAADRIARGEEWLQTNTLDGQKAHDSFLRVGEPGFFQEFGPAGYHVSIGFANPKTINGRLPGICAGSDPTLGSGTPVSCNNSVTGSVSTERMSRTPDQRLYSSGSNASFAFTQCYVSIGDPDGEDFAFTKCDGNGGFTLSGLPAGTWRITVFDQWNDMLVDGLSTPVALSGGATVDMGQIAMNQWQANIYTSTFFDQNFNGVRDSNESGLTLVSTNIRFRDGSYSNFNNTDLNGNAGFNEVFPLFSWYVVETDSTRYKNTGVHVVYDAGGPADGTPCGTATTPPTAPCGTSSIASFLANTVEQVPLPVALRVPGAVYCNNADCTGSSVATGPLVGGSSGPGGSTGRVDPPWVLSEGWQGFSGQNSFLEFGKKPYAVGENGGIRGEVTYASTRPFDDPALLIHTSWTPNVPGVTINLYQEGTAPDGVTQTLKLVDTTKTSSWDDWAQGFRSDGVPNMNCPGQGRDTGTAADLFFFSLFNQPNYLDLYNNVQHGTATTPRGLPNNSQFKCYDGMHNWNQLQPAPYDGAYQFPSVTSLNPTTGKPAGTNCTICVPNPSSTNPNDPAYDPYRAATPMLPAGKYVVEVVVPPGYELVKEEDKNILIGDNYIAPVAQQFGALASIFIMPDQAAVGASYNANNPNNPTQDLGSLHLPRGEGDTGSVEQFWPCVGASRIVPDYISLFPQSNEVSPFAGATRNLCDRKEVQLPDQASSLAKFWVFTSAHAAAHFTGVITDDFTSEFDPFSPQFGEKFSPANLPVAIKDFNGNEISRVYADQWGTYDGLNYSTWDVNPPNPTGYAPTMMVTCMNDPGTGIMPDPLFNPSYSQFCYEIPFMPGQTQYMDTPVVPTSAFAGAGYNNPDCNYPDATPAISEVDGDGIGPWVSAAGKTLTINTINFAGGPAPLIPGDVQVNDYGYSGPSATLAPFNARKVTRHYGFGATRGTVSIGGVILTPAQITGWTDTQITVTVPSGVPTCPVQQQQQYGGPATSQPARCGELVITAANGKQSVDTVTVTIGGKAPTRLIAGQTIQSAIDAASPGDMIIVPPGAYNELVLMWKPIRLQGVGAASSIINANTHPAGKLDPWRRTVNCLFGLAINGQPYTGNGALGGTNPYDSSGTFNCPGTGWNSFTGGPNNPQVDRAPREGIVGWDASLNGNLAEQLQEPSLMGAYEGAAITVLAKGVKIPNGATDIFGSGSEADYPAGSTLLSSANCVTSGSNSTNPYPSNFYCNPSAIDAMGITNASQGGGGIFVHSWGQYIQIANNRVNNNSGTLSGGISLGQGEFTDAYLAPNSGTIAPGSCQDSSVTNTQLPYCLNTHANVHHNSITNNSSTGDELFSGTPAGAGGVSICTGADYYQFNYNWVCGNLSTGDGGGVGHLGFSYNGDIEHNALLFNQSTNPTIATNGGGLIVMGAPPDGNTVGGLECGTVTDVDCVPGLGDGAGPGLVINANLLMGNAAESGSGGGVRFQAVNGTEVSRFPANPERWYSVQVTNNIIANNVAGWDGAGVSLEDSLVVNLINNTVVSNDTTASSGVLFNTLGAPIASSQSPPSSTNVGTSSLPQPAGLVALLNSPQLTSSFTTGPITCPTGHLNCTRFSNPILYNDIFWQNRSFYIGVGTLGPGSLNQQNVVSLYNAFTSAQVTTQPATSATAANGSGVIITGGTGACVSGVNYWDIGVRGDTGPSNHHFAGLTLSPFYSVITDVADYSLASLHNTGSNPTVVSQYCNGSRIPPECTVADGCIGAGGYHVPPGIADATVPNPIFNLTPAATVDEGNNWINISWGPLTMTNPTVLGTDGNYGGGSALGNYAPAANSPAINYIPSTAATYPVAPASDFFNNPRKVGNSAVDAGAVEIQTPITPAPVLTGISSPASGTGPRGSTNLLLTLNGTNLSGATGLTGLGGGVSLVAGSLTSTATSVTARLSITNTATLGVINIGVTTPGGTSNTEPFRVVGATVGMTGPTPALTTATPDQTTKNGVITFTNTASGANAGPLTLTAAPAIVKVGTAGGTFSITGGTCASGFVVNPGSNCTVNVQYVPGATTTTATAHVTITDTGAATTSQTTANFTAN